MHYTLPIGLFIVGFLAGLPVSALVVSILLSWKDNGDWMSPCC
jgi:hypothetical protein